jgi:hypothetical protein
MEISNPLRESGAENSKRNIRKGRPGPGLAQGRARIPRGHGQHKLRSRGIQRDLRKPPRPSHRSIPALLAHFGWPDRLGNTYFIWGAIF